MESTIVSTIVVAIVVGIVARVARVVAGIVVGIVAWVVEIHWVVIARSKERVSVVTKSKDFILKLNITTRS